MATTKFPLHGGISKLGEYYVEVRIEQRSGDERGDKTRPGHKLRLQVDTGSSSLVVAASRCETCRKPNPHSRANNTRALFPWNGLNGLPCRGGGKDFAPRRNLTLPATHDNNNDKVSCPICYKDLCGFALSYGDGSEEYFMAAEGVVVSLPVSVEGAKDAASAAEETRIYVILHERGNWPTKVDGILGMGLGRLNCNPRCFEPSWRELFNRPESFSLCFGDEGGVLEVNNHKPARVGGGGDGRRDDGVVRLEIPPGLRGGYYEVPIIGVGIMESATSLKVITSGDAVKTTTIRRHERPETRSSLSSFSASSETREWNAFVNERRNVAEGRYSSTDRVNRASSDHGNEHDDYAIIDSGTTVLLLPEDTWTVFVREFRTRYSSTLFGVRPDEGYFLNAQQDLFDSQELCLTVKPENFPDLALVFPAAEEEEEHDYQIIRVPPSLYFITYKSKYYCLGVQKSAAPRIIVGDAVLRGLTTEFREDSVSFRVGEECGNVDGLSRETRRGLVVPSTHKEKIKVSFLPGGETDLEGGTSSGSLISARSFQIALVTILFVWVLSMIYQKLRRRWRFRAQYREIA